MSSRLPVLLASIAALLIATTACSQAPETPAPAAPTSAPAGNAVPPTVSAPTATVSPSPTAAPAAPTVATTTGPAASSLQRLAERAMQVSEYSFDSTITARGQTVTAHHTVKGNSLRQEMRAGEMETVLLVDGRAGTAYMLMPDEKMAMKIDFSQAMNQVDNPGEWVESLPPSTRQVGTETVDGKEAIVFEVTEGPSKGKFWLWAERGLPLKIEAESPEGPVSVQFTNYRFEPVPDSVFELPPDTEVVDVPAGVPGGVPPATR